MNHPSVGQRDIRVHSQVALFIILTRIYHAFGPDVDVEVMEHELPRIEEFDKDLENWRRLWRPRISECRTSALLLPMSFILHTDCLQLETLTLETILGKP
jgi:hypothetical protein